MPVPNEQEKRAAMQIASAAAALSEAAQDFKAALISLADGGDGRKNSGLSVLDSRAAVGGASFSQHSAKGNSGIRDLW
jgi:hypothetical protein